MMPRSSRQDAGTASIARVAEYVLLHPQRLLEHVIFDHCVLQHIKLTEFQSAVGENGEPHYLEHVGGYFRRGGRDSRYLGRVARQFRVGLIQAGNEGAYGILMLREIGAR